MKDGARFDLLVDVNTPLPSKNMNLEALVTYDRCG